MSDLDGGAIFSSSHQYEPVAITIVGREPHGKIKLMRRYHIQFHRPDQKKEASKLQWM
jgi:hypothetical protein